jgi:hypothetical protein
VHDQPEPTEEEQEQPPERIEEEDAKSAPGHEDPEQVQPEDRG